MGRVRKHNEDSFTIVAEAQLAIVADGMGGLEGGEIASAMTVEMLSAELYDVMPTDEWDPDNLEEHENDQMIFCMEKFIPLFTLWLKKINKAVYNTGRNNPRLKRIGSTVTIFFGRGDRAILAHVGDSRIYLLRRNELHQVTSDHSYLNKMMAQGLKMTAAQQKKYRHVITQAIGVNEEVTPDVSLNKLEVGDLYMMCTDGLTDMVQFDEIRDILINLKGDLNNAAQRLVDLANARGGKDNITVVFAKVTE